MSHSTMSLTIRLAAAIKLPMKIVSAAIHHLMGLKYSKQDFYAVFYLVFVVCTTAVTMLIFLETARLSSSLRLKTKRTFRELGFFSPSTVDPVEKEETWEEEHDATKEIRKFSYHGFSPH